MIPPPNAAGSKPSNALTREPARDTLAPSSFGVIGNSKPAIAPAPAAMRGARPQLNTLGELEGLTATATLRPPGAVPPPPRALPMATPSLDAAGLDRDSPLDPGGEQPFMPLAGDLPLSPRTPQPRAEPVQRFESAAVAGGGAPPPFQPKPTAESSFESTLDMSGSASKKATQAALVEQTRTTEGTKAMAPGQPQTGATPAGGVPAPGLFIADEPLERRPQQPSLVTAQRQLITRMRAIVLVLGGLFLMAAGALVVMFVRRTGANANQQAVASTSAPPVLPGCTLAAPPSRISIIERSVPISALALPDGNVALAIADTKTSALGWIYDPSIGEAARKLDAASGSSDISHVTASDPLAVDHASPDFAFGQTLTPGLALGVGPTGLLRRGDDGATGVVWPLGAGVRVTPPRTITIPGGHFVAFRQGGAEGQIMTGWLKPNGAAAGEISAVEGAPKSLGTPNTALLGQRAVALFSARNDKSEPYKVYAASAGLLERTSAPTALDLPSEGGGAIAPSLTQLSAERYLVQWTDGNVGQYQVHVRQLDAALKPVSDALLVSAKGANAGQGTLITTDKATVSFFIQTTAGHDELWGVALSCH